MFAKVVCIASLLLAVAQYVQGHAYSSAHITRHDGHPEIVHVHGGHGDHGGHWGHGGHGHDHHGHIDYHAHPKYKFEYKVSDPHTGDIKSQHEHRDGDVVKGYYSLHQADGHMRDVHYHGDKHTGFHNDVKYEIKHVVPHKHHF